MGRSAGIDGELKGAAITHESLNQDQRLGRMREPHRELRSPRRSELLHAAGIMDPEFQSVKIERETEMLEEIVAEVTIELRSDGAADHAQIGNPDIDVLPPDIAERNRIHIRQKHIDCAAGRMSLLRADALDRKRICEFRRD
jgi:hypothetical protein